MQRSASGETLEFVINGGTHGITIHNGVVYACQGPRVRGFNLTNAVQVFDKILTGASFLNGIAINSSGIAYLSDFTNNRIYKLNVNDSTFWQYVTNTVHQPNGLVIDAPRNRLLFCCWGNNARIRAINFADSSNTVLIQTQYSNLDGIKLDKYDNVYISSWSPNPQKIIRYDINFSLPVVEVITSGLSNPADIFINKSKDTLVCPNSGNHTITFHNIGNIAGVNQISSEIPNGYSISQNYPNPFNPTTNFEFQIADFGFVSLKIFDQTGKEVTTLVSQSLIAGTYGIKWNAANYVSGIYYYRLQSNKYSEVKKLVLVK